MKNEIINSAFLDEDEEKSFYKNTFLKFKKIANIESASVYYKTEGRVFLIYKISFSDIKKGLFSLNLPIRIENSTIGHISLTKKIAFTKPEKDFLKKEVKIISDKIKDFEISKIYKNQLEILQNAIVEKNSTAEKLKEKNEELIETDKIRSEFFANISHELRTPLNSIIGFSTALKEGIAGPLNEKQKNYTNKILTSAIHLTGLINDILDMTKIEAGQMKANLKDISPVLIINEVINIIEPLAYDKNIKLETNFKFNGEIALDYLKFRQIMYNLIGNAIKFSHPNSKIIISTLNKNGKTFIKVKDFGIGIEKKEQKRIFEKFVQLDNIYTKQYSSTGLGLTITNEFIKLQNGKIRLKSKPDYGSEFILEF